MTYENSDIPELFDHKALGLLQHLRVPHCEFD